MSDWNKDKNAQVMQWAASKDQDDPFEGQQPLAPPIEAPQNVPRGIPSEPSTEDTSTAARVASSHPVDERLNNEIQGNIGKINQYGPDQEKQVMDSLMKQQNSFGSRVGRAGAALSDAIMQGVAGEGNPGNLKNLEDEEQRRIDNQGNLIPKLQQMTNEQIGATQKQEELSSSTPLGSKQAQAYQAIFKQLFPQMTNEELQKISANPAVAEKIFPGVGAIVEKQIAAQIQKEGIDVQRQKVTAETANQQAERKQADVKMKAEHPILSAMGKLGPGNSEPEFNHATIPSRSVYKAPDGTFRRKQ